MRLKSISESKGFSLQGIEIGGGRGRKEGRGKGGKVGERRDDVNAYNKPN